MDNNRKELSGLVQSNTMDKTVVVNIVRSFPHPVYKKYVKFSKKYYVHDENNKCECGDTVLIEESKPLSKLKRWRVKKILKKAAKI
ncbi:MAG: 30S ribosomal protein S17 [Candidatus Marinimicrobia bacterium]|nr:30S ribosomal protein S17 [Candidatus Neomarinimicrobiota bacterium]|tara:strand:- start:47423 stop:47680 length:258 start_codon:yes stop_codon:yes gene_type:complete